MHYKIYAYLAMIVLALAILSHAFSNRVVVTLWTLAGLFVVVIFGIIVSLDHAPGGSRGLTMAFLLCVFLLAAWVVILQIGPILVSTSTVILFLVFLWYRGRTRQRGEALPDV